MVPRVLSINLHTEPSLIPDYPKAKSFFQFVADVNLNLIFSNGKLFFFARGDVAPEPHLLTSREGMFKHRGISSIERLRGHPLEVLPHCFAGPNPLYVSGLGEIHNQKTVDCTNIWLELIQ